MLCSLSFWLGIIILMCVHVIIILLRIVKHGIWLHIKVKIQTIVGSVNGSLWYHLNTLITGVAHHPTNGGI